MDFVLEQYPSRLVMFVGLRSDFLFKNFFLSPNSLKTSDIKLAQICVEQSLEK